MTHPTRRILLVAHPRRPEAISVAKGVIERLTALGIDVSLQADEARALDLTDSSRVHIRPYGQAAEAKTAAGGDLVGVVEHGAVARTAVTVLEIAPGVSHNEHLTARSHCIDASCERGAQHGRRQRS